MRYLMIGEANMKSKTTLTTKEVADMIFEMLCKNLVDPDDVKWIRERANNIAQALAGVTVLP